MGRQAVMLINFGLFESPREQIIKTRDNIRRIIEIKASISAIYTSQFAGVSVSLLAGNYGASNQIYCIVLC